MSFGVMQGRALLKEILINTICVDSRVFEDPKLMEFWDWLIQIGLGLSKF